MSYDAPPQTNLQPSQPHEVVREHSTYMTDRDSEKLCLLFADGLRSGVGYARILDFMERQRMDPKMTSRLRVAILEYGDQLGEAFARFGILDAPARKLILVAEEQGALPETFKDQSKIYGDRYKRKKTVLYGLVESGIFLCLGAFYFRGIIRNLREIALSKNGADMVWDIMTLATVQSLVFFMVAGGLGYFWLNLPVDSSLREGLGRLWFRIPVVSSPGRLVAIGSFGRYLRQSLRSGMDIFRSIDLAAEATNSPFFIASLEDVYGVLEAGYPLDQALRHMKGLPNDFIDYVGIGEETGTLEENLLFLADRYDDLAVEAYKRSLSVYMYIMRFTFIIAILVFVVFGGVIEHLMGTM